MTISILLADDHQIFRESLRVLLEKQPFFQIVGEAANGLEAVQLTQQLQPDIVVLDMSMPGMNGLEALRQIKELQPGCRIVALSSYNDDGYVVHAFRQGAAAYVLKDQGSTDLLEALHIAASGGRYLSPSLSIQNIKDYLSLETDTLPQPPLDPYDTLTPRERQVLELAAQGLTNKEGGHILNISPRTVETHLSHVMRKLKISTRHGLIRYVEGRQKRLLNL